MYKEKDGGQTVTHLSKTEARGGSRTPVTRNILFISLGLVIILFLIALGFGFLNTEKTGADQVTADNTAQSNPH